MRQVFLSSPTERLENLSCLRGHILSGCLDQDIYQNSVKTKVPFYDYTETDPVKNATDGVEPFRNDGHYLIIAHKSGRHKQENALFAGIGQMAESVDPTYFIFVLDSAIGKTN